MRNLYAYTAPGSFYPSYISVNEGKDGVEISVRPPNTRDGQANTVRLTRRQAEEMARAILGQPEYAQRPPNAETCRVLGECHFAPLGPWPFSKPNTETLPASMTY